MIKYTDTQVTFSEIPDEVILCINISNCPHKCPGCHSPELQEDIGNELTSIELRKLLIHNKGITAICFMGGENDISSLNKLISQASWYHSKLKIGVYLGCDEIPKNLNIKMLDYIKIGSYNQQLGGLNSNRTNQRMYRNINNELVDITDKFWK